MKRIDQPSPTRRKLDRFSDTGFLGVEALTFLAADEERLGDFLAASGITHLTLRDAARESGFLHGILNHIAADERLLIAFASHLGAKPDETGQTIARMGGPPEWRSP